MATFYAKVKKFLREEDAPTSVEYGVMVALIAAVVIGGATVLGNNTNNLFSTVANTIGGLGGG